MIVANMVFSIISTLFALAVLSTGASAVGLEKSGIIHWDKDSFFSFHEVPRQNTRQHRVSREYNIGYCLGNSNAYLLLEEVLKLPERGCQCHTRLNEYLSVMAPKQASLAMGILLVGLALLEFICCLWSSIICCSAVCCGQSVSCFQHPNFPTIQTKSFKKIHS